MREFPVRSDFVQNPVSKATVTIDDRTVIQEIVEYLLWHDSCWFELTPLPNKCYELAVKEDRRDVLNCAFEHLFGEDWRKRCGMN